MTKPTLLNVILKTILGSKVSHIVFGCTFTFSAILHFSTPHFASLVAEEMVVRMDERYMTKYEYWDIQSSVDKDKILTKKKRPKTPHPEHLNGEISFCNGDYGVIEASGRKKCDIIDKYRTGLLLK